MAKTRDAPMATRPTVTESMIHILLEVPTCLNYLDSVLIEVCTISEWFVEVIDEILY